MSDAALRVGKRRRLLRVLLGFEHDPAGVAPQFLEDCDIVDDSIARHSIDAEVRALAEDRIKEAPVAGLRLLHLLISYVLAMDVADAGLITPRKIGWVCAAPGRVTGVEEKIRRRLGMGHESIDVG